MRNVMTITRRELAAWFYSPMAYGVITLFLVLAGIMFDLLTFEPGAEASIRGVFGPWMLLILAFMLAMLTMRLLSEEYRNGTIETLMTAPVTDAEVIGGKYLGALVFYAVMLLGTLIYPVLVSKYGGLDSGLTFACYLGLLLTGALYIAVGLFFSACTQNQIVAGLAAFVVLAVFTFLTNFIGQMQEGTLRVTLQHLSVAEHYESFMRGMIDFTHVTFFITTTAVFLFLAVKALEFRRWR
ncbi:MAG: ABC transporter permease subunit [Phycisphaerales bacterium]|nr:ABC transporter permease subunit [Phycisphaerales bacterium]